MGDVYSAFDPDLDRKLAISCCASGGKQCGWRGWQTRLREAQADREAVAIRYVSSSMTSAPSKIGVHRDGVRDEETLSFWMHAQPHSWREILGVFIAAGRGCSTPTMQSGPPRLQAAT